MSLTASLVKSLNTEMSAVLFLFYFGGKGMPLLLIKSFVIDSFCLFVGGLKSLQQLRSHRAAVLSVTDPFIKILQ